MWNTIRAVGAALAAWILVGMLFGGLMGILAGVGTFVLMMRVNSLAVS